jgi:transglutaminase-like putative cysteine protease
MQEEVDHIVRTATNDVHAVYEILEWTSRNVRADRNRHARALVFYYTYEVDEAVYLRNLWPGVSGNVMQGTYLYADSMYWNSTTGDSCSYSTLMCSMLRAAGLPCRILQTLDPIYSHADQSEEYVSMLERTWNNDYENQPSGQPADWLNHCYMEVYLGGVWVRVGKTINFYQEPRFYEAYEAMVDTLNFKILSVADLTEVNFSQTYPTNWITERPYYTLLIEDQYAIH